MRFNSCDSAFWKGYVLDTRSRHTLNRCTNLSNKPFSDSISHIEQRPSARRKIAFRLPRCRFPAFTNAFLFFQEVSCLLLKDTFLFVERQFPSCREVTFYTAKGCFFVVERVLLVYWEVILYLLRDSVSYSEKWHFIYWSINFYKFLTRAESFPYMCGHFSLHVRKAFRTCKEFVIYY